jgi:dephospho-CoA kinase
MIVIGLTGGIASGKSTVSGVLSDLGASVIDADTVGHEAFRPGTDAWREVVDDFGTGILGNGDEIDRGKLADIVFQSPGARERLNSIMHPTIRRMVEQRIEDLRRGGAGVVVVEAALLIEAKWMDLVDTVWVVEAPEKSVVSRLCEQKGFTEEQARARINSQMSSAERSEFADVAIQNDLGLDALTEKVRELWRRVEPSNTS